MRDEPIWLTWAAELNSLAQAGLYYYPNIYDKERYERIRDIAAEIVAYQTDLPAEKARDLFSGDDGYITPKLDTRAAVFDDEGRILLVREASGLWALPGGWVDADQSVLENTVKEVREEAGLDVTAERLIAVIDRDRHNERLFPRKIILCFVLCVCRGGGFVPNSETVEARYFAADELPAELARTKTTEAEIDMCFRAYADPQWQTVFD